MEKRGLVVIFILMAFFVSAVSGFKEETVMEFLNNMIKTENSIGNVVVIGEDSKSTDVVAAQEFISFIQKETKKKMAYELSGNVTKEKNLILLGNPCENPLIPKIEPKLKCSSFPYSPGEAYIKVELNNILLVAGATGKDVMMGARALTEYRKSNTSDYNLNNFLVVGTKEKYEIIPFSENFTCKNDICELGEKLFCVEDCKGKPSCDSYCKQSGSLAGSCREVKEEAVCLKGEIQRSMEYCDDMKICCCDTGEDFLEENKTVAENKTIPLETEPSENELEEETFFENIINFLGNKWKWIIWIFIFIILGVGIVIGVSQFRKYYLNKKAKEAEPVIIETNTESLESEKKGLFRESNTSKILIPEKLVDYIKEMISYGFSEKVIKEELLKKGWDAGMIDKGFTVAKIK